MSAFDEFSPAAPYVLWLAAFAAALGLALFGIMCRLFRAGRVGKASWLAWSAASLFPGAICWADALRRLDGALTGSLALAANGALVVLAAVVCYWIARRHVAATCAVKADADEQPADAHQIAGRTASPAWRLSWGLVLGNAVVAVWAGTCFYRTVDPGDSWLPPQRVAAANWVTVPGARATTDAGTPIDLLKAEDGRLNDVPLAAIFGDRFRERVIEMAATDDRANCHGWVFAAGRYAVGGSDVDAILADNQYDQAEQPQAGDVIVYRDAEGNVVHTGLVRLADGDMVLVESKWGAHARYLHRPLDQAYATRYGFYRSSRQGHLISMEGEASDEPGKSSDGLGSDAIASVDSGLDAADWEADWAAAFEEAAALEAASEEAAAVEPTCKTAGFGCPGASIGPSPTKKTPGKFGMPKPRVWPKTNPLWWPKRPTTLSYKPFAWYGLGGPWPNPGPPHSAPAKRQSRG